MKETGSSAASDSAAQGEDGLHARIAALRQRGADRLDPARFLALEALARRLQAQAAPVRKLLQQRALAALEECERQFAQTAAAPPARRADAREAERPLAALHAHIRTRLAEQAEQTLAGDAPPADALRSAWRFRQSWDRGRTLDQLQDALLRRPAKAGPLNSHALVLQALGWIGELSPDYLRRFVAQVETLQWLEAASARPARPAVKSAKAAKPGRSGSASRKG